MVRTLIGILTALGIGLCLTGRLSSNATAEGTCPPSQSTATDPSSTPTSESARVKLKPEQNSAAWTIHLDRGRGVKTANLVFESEGPALDLTAPIRAFIIGDLVSEGNERVSGQEPQSSFVAEADPGKPVLLTLHACFDPPENLKPGLYKGAVQISGPAIEPISIPITVSARTTNIVLPVVALFFGAVVGLVLKVFGAMRQEGAMSLKAALKYLGTWQMGTAIVVGLIALGPLWIKLYDGDRTFSLDLGDLGPLILGAAGAFVTTTTFADILKGKAT